MGTPDFSVPVLTAMKEAGHDMLAAVTQPDKPKGRGKEMQMTPVKAKALELGIPVLQPKRVRDPEFVEQLRELKPDVMVVVAFGQILTKEVWRCRSTDVSMYMLLCFQCTAVLRRFSM